MRLLLALLLLLPSALFAQEEKPVDENHLAAAKEYFKTLRLEEEHRALYTEANRKLIGELRKQRPCIPASVLDHAGEVGEFPAAEFEKYYEGRIVTKLTQADLKDLVSFYGSFIGKTFVDWRMKNSGKASSPVPISDEMDVVFYAQFEEVLKKEHFALVELSGKPLLPEDIRKQDDERIASDIEKLVQPYVDKDGNCK